MLHAVNITHFSAVRRVFDVMSLLPDGFEMSQLPLFSVVEQVMAKTSTEGVSKFAPHSYTGYPAVRTCRSIRAAPC